MTDARSILSVETARDHEEWSRAFSYWLNTRPENTARAYRQAWSSLIEQTGKIPSELDYLDVAGWVEWMKAAQMTSATINLRLAGISSFYRFLGEASRQRLANPTQGKSLRQKVYRWQGAHFLDKSAVRDLLSAIDRCTVRGARDYALLLAYLLTGRRNSEIRTLRWGDIETTGGKRWYHWQGKGKSRRDLLPDPVHDAVRDYLAISGRLNKISAGDYIFISSRGKRARGALSACQIGRLLNGRLDEAGIEGHYRVHDLRHTAAMLRKTAGADIETISGFLNHSNVNTTMTYLHSLEGHADESWADVWALVSGERDQIHTKRIAKNHGRSHRG